MVRSLLVVAALASPAAADQAFRIGSQPAWFASVGGTGGGSIASDTRGGFVGGELSIVRLRENRMGGIYADAFYDFGIDGTYVTLGPELALVRRSRKLPLAFGIDGGGVVRFAGERAFGATGRVFVAVAGTVGLYARYAFVDDERDDHIVQLGMTFKFAQPLSKGGR